MFITFVIFVDVPEIFPVVVFNDINYSPCVVWSDVQFIAELSAMLLILLLMTMFLMTR